MGLYGDSLEVGIDKGIINTYLGCITGRGYYIYTEADGRIKSDKAQLDGIRGKAPANGGCITFWYHMYGADMGSLTVYTNETDGVLGPVQFSRSGFTKKSEWLEGKVSVAPGSEFQVSRRVQSI